MTPEGLAAQLLGVDQIAVSFKTNPNLKPGFVLEFTVNGEEFHVTRTKRPGSRGDLRVSARASDGSIAKGHLNLVDEAELRRQVQKRRSPVSFDRFGGSQSGSRDYGGHGLTAGDRAHGFSHDGFNESQQ